MAAVLDLSSDAHERLLAEPTAAPSSEGLPRENLKATISGENQLQEAEDVVHELPMPSEDVVYKTANSLNVMFRKANHKESTSSAVNLDAILSGEPLKPTRNWDELTTSEKKEWSAVTKSALKWARRKSVQLQRCAHSEFDTLMEVKRQKLPAVPLPVAQQQPKPLSKWQLARQLRLQREAEARELEEMRERLERLQAEKDAEHERELAALLAEEAGAKSAEERERLIAKRRALQQQEMERRLKHAAELAALEGCALDVAAEMSALRAHEAFYEDAEQGESEEAVDAAVRAEREAKKREADALLCSILSKSYNQDGPGLGEGELSAQPAGHWSAMTSDEREALKIIHGSLDPGFHELEAEYRKSAMDRSLDPVVGVRDPETCAADILCPSKFQVEAANCKLAMETHLLSGSLRLQPHPAAERLEPLEHSVGAVVDARHRVGVIDNIHNGSLPLQPHSTAERLEPLAPPKASAGTVTDARHQAGIINNAQDLQKLRRAAKLDERPFWIDPGVQPLPPCYLPRLEPDAPGAAHSPGRAEDRDSWEGSSVHREPWKPPGVVSESEFTHMGGLGVEVAKKQDALSEQQHERLHLEDRETWKVAGAYHAKLGGSNSLGPSIEERRAEATAVWGRGRGAHTSGGHDPPLDMSPGGKPTKPRGAAEYTHRPQPPSSEPPSSRRPQPRKGLYTDDGDARFRRGRRDFEIVPPLALGRRDSIPTDVALATRPTVLPLEKWMVLPLDKLPSAIKVAGSTVTAPHWMSQAAPDGPMSGRGGQVTPAGPITGCGGQVTPSGPMSGHGGRMASDGSMSSCDAHAVSDSARSYVFDGDSSRLNLALAPEGSEITFSPREGNLSPPLIRRQRGQRLPRRSRTADDPRFRKRREYGRRQSLGVATGRAGSASKWKPVHNDTSQGKLRVAAPLLRAEIGSHRRTLVLDDNPAPRHIHMTSSLFDFNGGLVPLATQDIIRLPKIHRSRSTEKEMANQRLPI
ncbi:hypothetical protein CYMTET_15269 [Cymbomonas tetramitiformis]|uniref:Uncharacterized protein n=1 Tax=Cymbomonas tetramitiformis TaxID=36881 RepID=A0AAE0L9B6_9CHLO|nr:hypothetical protein CYMTET_15269 [Cymbomonas tetramitiformis]